MKLRSIFVGGILLVSFGTLIFSASYGVSKSNNKGIDYYKMGQTGEALDFFSDVISEEEQYGEVYNNLGSTLFKQQELDRAEVSYKQALPLLKDEKRGDVYYNLGNVFIKKGDLKQAKSYYQKSLEFSPTDSVAKYNLEVVLNLIAHQKLQQQGGDSGDDSDEDSDKTSKDQSDESGESGESEKDGKSSKDDSDDSGNDNEDNQKLGDQQAKNKGGEEERKEKKMEKVLSIIEQQLLQQRENEARQYYIQKQLEKHSKNRRAVEKDW